MAFMFKIILKRQYKKDDLCLFLFPHCHSVKTTGIFAIEYQNIVCMLLTESYLILQCAH